MTPWPEECPLQQLIIEMTDHFRDTDLTIWLIWYESYFDHIKLVVSLIKIFYPRLGSQGPVRSKISKFWTAWNLKTLISKKVLILRWSLFWKGGFRNNIDSAYFKDGFKLRQVEHHTVRPILDYFSLVLRLRTCPGLNRRSELHVPSTSW